LLVKKSADESDAAGETVARLLDGKSPDALEENPNVGGAVAHSRAGRALANGWEKGQALSRARGGTSDSHPKFGRGFGGGNPAQHPAKNTTATANMATNTDRP